MKRWSTCVWYNLHIFLTFFCKLQSGILPVCLPPSSGPTRKQLLPSFTRWPESVVIYLQPPRVCRRQKIFVFITITAKDRKKTHIASRNMGRHAGLRNHVGCRRLIFCFLTHFFSCLITRSRVPIGAKFRQVTLISTTCRARPFLFLTLIRFHSSTFTMYINQSIRNWFGSFFI